MISRVSTQRVWSKTDHYLVSLGDSLRRESIWRDLVWGGCRGVEVFSVFPRRIDIGEKPKIDLGAAGWSLRMGLCWDGNDKHRVQSWFADTTLVCLAQFCIRVVTYVPTHDRRSDIGKKTSNLLLNSEATPKSRIVLIRLYTIQLCRKVNASIEDAMKDRRNEGRGEFVRILLWVPIY